MSAPLFQVSDLHVSIDGKEILKGVNLTIKKGEIHALMGRNGSGKSTLAHVVMGHPRYQVTRGEILYEGENVVEMKPDDRARKGLFLAFQYPIAVPGVTVTNFLRACLKSLRAQAGGPDMPVKEFRLKIKDSLRKLEMEEAFMSRYVNDGFSGGEKKRLEIVQMAMINPTMAVLDETDSGLDIDALKIVAKGVNTLMSPDLGILIITHYQRILNFIKPHHVHVLADGRMVRSGGPELAHQLEAEGYEGILQEAAAHA